LAAGAVISAVQVAVLYLFKNVVLLLFIGPIIGWSVATWSLRTWRQTKVWHAWPIAFADLAWIVLAIGLEDGGPRGLSIAFAALAVLSLFAGTLCFFGRDGGAS
jgi:hypothetical protein